MEFRFPIEAGILIRGEVKRRMLALADLNKVDITITEDKGLLESLYRVTLRGEKERIRKVVDGVSALAKDYENG